jgi:glycosyltransferase involved in cell wall biosynthesis
MSLKIANISLTDLYGGASIFSFRQHNSFLKKNINSKLFVLNKYSNLRTVNKISYKKNIFNTLLKKIFFFFLTNKNKYSFYNQGLYKINNIDYLSQLTYFKPDVVIFYTNSDLINPKLFEKIFKKNTIFLFYPMDYEFLTGGCHYAWNCNGYKSKCMNCPAVFFPLKKIPNKNFLEKEKYLKKIRHYYVAGTKDFKLKIKKSSIFQKNSNVLLNYLGMDLNKFWPKNINKKNDQLNFCFRASLNPRKGQAIFLETIKYLMNYFPKFFNNVKFNIIGDSSICNFFDTLNIKYKFYDNIFSEDDLVNFYNSSDFMINYSIEDAGPMMINESLACGVPVISFRVGGAKEFILNSRNGFLIDKISHVNLARKMNFVKNISNKNILNMKIFSRKFALKKFNIDKNTPTLINFIKKQLKIYI